MTSTTARAHTRLHDLCGQFVGSIGVRGPGDDNLKMKVSHSRVPYLDTEGVCDDCLSFLRVPYLFFGLMEG
jgi:hypothetical protein